MPGSVRVGAPLAPIETEETGAQTSGVAATLPPSALRAATLTVNGPSPAGSPLSVVPSQSQATAPDACAPMSMVRRVSPEGLWMVTVTALASLARLTAPARPPLVRG